MSSLHGALHRIVTGCTHAECIICEDFNDCPPWARGTIPTRIQPAPLNLQAVGPTVESRLASVQDQLTQQEEVIQALCKVVRGSVAAIEAVGVIDEHLLYAEWHKAQKAQGAI